MISVKKSAHTVKLNLSVGTHYTVHKKHLVNSVGFAVINKILFEISEIDNHGAGLLEYSPLYESDGYFVGVNGKSENDARNYYIRKEDYYSGNFSAAFY